MAILQTIKSLDGEHQVGGRTVLTRVYIVGYGKTLADLSLEEEDSLPGDSTAEIIESRFDVAKDEKNVQHRVVRATAEKWTAIATKGAMSELQGSQKVIATATRFKVVRLFHVARSSLTKTGGGWTCSGMPLRGDLLDIPGMTWNPNENPVCTAVSVNPYFRKNTARIIAVYESSRGVD